MLYDIIVVGAGPAGSISARICAQAGLQVLLLDKEQFPREKPCAGGVSLRSIQALNSRGIRLPSTLIERTLTGVQFMGPDWTPFLLRSDRPLGYTIRRSNFDHYLTQQAEMAGANFLENHYVMNLEQHKDRIICKTKKDIFEARLIIGADGATSKIARITGLRTPLSADKIGIGVEADVPLPQRMIEEILDPTVMIVWFLNIPNGYFWVFPRKKSLSIGIAGMAGKIRNPLKLLRTLSRVFSQRVGLPVFSVPNIRSHLLPTFSFHAPLTTHRVILVGDAAGFVDFFTGQGICYALESGIIAAQTAIRAVKINQFDVETLDKYGKLVRRRFGEELRCSLSASRIMHDHLYGGFRLARRLQCANKFLWDFATGGIDYYRIRRNPLSYAFKLLIYELQHRLVGW